MSLNLGLESDYKAAFSSFATNSFLCLCPVCPHLDCPQEYKHCIMLVCVYLKNQSLYQYRLDSAVPIAKATGRLHFLLLTSTSREMRLALSLTGYHRDTCWVAWV